MDKNKVEEDILFPAPNEQHFHYEKMTMRILGNKVYRRPKTEHLHEFIYKLLGLTLGSGWVNSQRHLPQEEQHKILQWVTAQEIFMKNMEAVGQTGKLVFLSGDAKELMSLASDVYYLKLSSEIPKNTFKRLKNKEQFQGARYEISVAAALVRAGFEIEWISPLKDRKTPEFNAIHKYTGEKIAIEVKSRVRDAILKDGEKTNKFIELGGTKLDILSLYNDAMGHNPEDKPFGVFIDINLPHNRPTHNWFWKDALHEQLKQNGDIFFGNVAPSFFAITNSAWHYQKNNRAGKGEGLLIRPKPSLTSFPLKNRITLLAIEKSLNRFGKLPEDRLFVI